MQIQPALHNIKYQLPTFSAWCIFSLWLNKTVNGVKRRIHVLGRLIKHHCSITQTCQNAGVSLEGRGWMWGFSPTCSLLYVWGCKWVFVRLSLCNDTIWKVMHVWLLMRNMRYWLQWWWAPLIHPKRPNVTHMHSNFVCMRRKKTAAGKTINTRCTFT